MAEFSAVGSLAISRSCMGSFVGYRIRTGSAMLLEVDVKLAVDRVDPRSAVLGRDRDRRRAIGDYETLSVLRRRGAVCRCACGYGTGSRLASALMRDAPAVAPKLLRFGDGGGPKGGAFFGQTFRRGNAVPDNACAAGSAGDWAWSG